MTKARNYKGFWLSPLNNPNGNWVQILDSKGNCLDTTICQPTREQAFINAQKIIDSWEIRQQNSSLFCFTRA